MLWCFLWSYIGQSLGIYQRKSYPFGIKNNSEILKELILGIIILRYYNIIYYFLNSNYVSGSVFSTLHVLSHISKARCGLLLMPFYWWRNTVDYRGQVTFPKSHWKSQLISFYNQDSFPRKMQVFTINLHIYGNWYVQFPLWP